MGLDLADSTLLDEAREHFKEGRYEKAEPILNQLILQNQKTAETFHMLATILYDRGKFNKAIRAFRRALELDPSFTDASIGLSIILNDLGKYEEGRKVFEEAQSMLAMSDRPEESIANEKLASKHDELGELYFGYGRYSEALDQYYKSLNLSTRRPEITMNIVECLLNMNKQLKAITLLRELIKDYPGFMGARLRLGKVYYEDHQIPEAIEAWESVLNREPENQAAKDYLSLVSGIETTHVEEGPYGELEG